MVMGFERRIDSCLRSVGMIIELTHEVKGDSEGPLSITQRFAPAAA
jgi:hypothetical protein